MAANDASRMSITLFFFFYYSIDCIISVHCNLRGKTIISPSQEEPLHSK